LSQPDESDRGVAHRHGLAWRFLRLIVEVDSSRSIGNRLKAGLALAGLIVLFGVLGYGVPALFARYFN